MQAVRLAIVLSSLSLSACGGGGAPSSQTNATVVNGSAGLTGIYDIHYGQFHGTYALLDDGRFYGAHFVSGTALAGHPYGTLSSANSVEKKEPITWVNFIDDVNQVGRLELDPVFGRSASQGTLKVSIKSGMGEFTTTVSAQKGWGDGSAKLLYQDAIPLATLAGSYSATVRTYGISQPQATATTFDIDQAGNVSATAVGCTFTGKIKQYGHTGIYDLQWMPGGAGCRFTSPHSGIVMPVSMANGKPSLIFMGSTAPNGHAAVFRATHL